MNIRILAASALALVILAPVADAAVHKAPTAVARNHKTRDTDKCIKGVQSLATTECKISGASFNTRNVQSVVKTTVSEIDRGTGGSGDSLWVRPKANAHKLILKMKADPNLDRGTGNNPSQL